MKHQTCKTFWSVSGIANVALIATFLFSSSVIRAQGVVYPTSTRIEEPQSEARERCVDFDSLRVRLRFDAFKSQVYGEVTHTFVPLRERVDSIVFDAVNIKITEARCSGKPVRFVSRDSSVTIYPDPPLRNYHHDSVNFVYECKPRRGIHFTGWSDATNRARKQIWTQGEDSDNRNWIPMYDYPNDKMISETVITFDSSYQVLSNGSLRSKKRNGDGTVTWHYAMSKPHVGYLIMFAVGTYAVEERTTTSGLPVHLWYYPEYPERIASTYRLSTEIIEFMEKQLSTPYPWESYSQIPVQDYIFGAMENTTATVFGDFSFTDNRMIIDRSYLGTNVHELTHQWFGDYVTERTWKNLWLHESFATFYPKLFFRQYAGEDVYQWMRRGEQNAAIGAGAGDRLPIIHTQSGTSRRYQKGSAVLDMLRYVCGENDFDRAITYYLKKNAYGLVSTDEFFTAFQETTGLNLDWFSSEWLVHGGEPSYKVRTSDVIDATSKQRSTIFTVEQTQLIDALSPAFVMPIVFEVHYEDGSVDKQKVIVDKQFQQVMVANTSNKNVSYCLFDPGSYIIKKVDFKKSNIQLKNQALFAPMMIDRYDAVRSLATDSTLTEAQSEELLVNIYNRESFHAIREEIVGKLCRSQSQTAMKLLSSAARDTSADVRKAVVNGLRRIPEELRDEVEVMLKDTSFGVIESAFNKLSESFPERTDDYILRLQGVSGPAARVRLAVLEKMALKSDSKAIAELCDLVTDGFEFQTRQNAMNVLKRVNYCDSTVVKSIVAALVGSNNRLADVARGVCEYWVQQTRYRQLFVDYYRSKTWSSYEKDILVKLIGEGNERRRRRP